METHGQRGRVVAIIQARMTSSRLPGKVLMDICGRPALQRMLERVLRARRIDQVVVATTVNATDDPVVELCDSLAVKTFRGDEQNVLGRFLAAADENGAESVVRLTADCPMIDPELIDEIVTAYEVGEADYVSNCNVRTYPDGLDVEVFTMDALREADRSVEQPFPREHVTPYIRGSHPQYGAGDFHREQVTFMTDLGHLRWTLDTAEDMERIRALVCNLPEEYSWLDALSLATRRPELLGVEQ